MKLRPHHVLDIVQDYGAGTKFEPHHYGHSLHTVSEAIVANPDIDMEFVIAGDAICQGCMHLQPGGGCDDMMGPPDKRRSKQAYNDAHDAKLMRILGIAEGAHMPVREYLGRVSALLPGFAKECAHPSEDPEKRLANLRQGLAKMGIG